MADSIDRICKAVDKYKDSEAELKKIEDYVQSNKLHYSPQQYAFICEHINNAKEDLEGRRKVDKLLKD